MRSSFNITRLTHYARHIPAWLFDLLLGIAVTLVVASVISADQGGRQDPDAVAYLFAVAFGGLMLLRRRFPVAVLVVTMVLIFVYYSQDYPAIGLAVPVAAALYSGADQGHVLAAAAVSAVLLIVSTYFRLVEGQSVAFLLGYELVSSLMLMVAAIALGVNTRAQRALAAEQEQTARLIAQEHAHRAEQRVQDERMRIARDLHDVLGHSIAVISLQANVAGEAIGRDDEAARRALAHIQTASQTTMRDLRATLKLLRSVEEGDVRPPASLANLPLLVEQAAAGGLHVTLQTTGELAAFSATLSATVDAAAYRIVQEALTNVMRHAAATEVTVAITADDNSLSLRIADNGRGVGDARGALTPGSGLAGMTERARLLGGTLSAAPQPDSGFLVDARLPLASTIQQPAEELP